MAYGVIDIQYGGARSTKVVGKEEFYSAQSVPAMAKVDLYINMEYYSNLNDELEDVDKKLKDVQAAYDVVYAQLKEQRNELIRVKREYQVLSERLDRANKIIDWML